MSFTRREFVHASGVALLGAVVRSRPLLVRLDKRAEPVPPIEDPRLKAFAMRGVDAARSAGASYADVRLTHTKTREYVGGGGVWDSESMTVGVRALVDGYWGFASGPVLTADELVRLGGEAVSQARANAVGGTRRVELAPAPVVEDGSWTMPVARDPLAVSPFEVQDFLASVAIYTERTPGARVTQVRAMFAWQELAFASSAGSYCTQRRVQSSGVVALQLEQGEHKGGGALECLTPAGLGWELFTAPRIPFVREHALYEMIDRKLAEIAADFSLPVKPVDVGRYDCVFDAPSMAALVDKTLGRATELDRALGYEANAGGTSYLSNPLGMLGTYQAGAPHVTLTADRSTPGSAAWVQWDDDGVVPDTFPIVENGVLVDFQTTRETASRLAPYYAKAGKPLRSHGCAAAPEALDAPTLHTANLVLAPGSESVDFDGLVAGLEKGVAVKRADVDLDFQAVSGMGQGRTYEVKRGKRVAIIEGAGFLFSAPQLWKGVVRVGGTAAARRYGHSSAKGEPQQTCDHSVTAPPAVIKELAIINPLQKA